MEFSHKIQARLHCKTDMFANVFEIIFLDNFSVLFMVKLHFTETD